MSVENRVSKNNTDRSGLKGKWTIIDHGCVNEVQVETADDLMKHRIPVDDSSVLNAFGVDDRNRYSEWLNGHQQKKR